MGFGYLDPASGSAIVGAVAAGAAGISVAARTMVAKMRIRRGDAGPDPDEKGEPTPDASQ